MFISADKTQNFCDIKKEDHEKMLYENVTKTCEIANPSLPKKINIESKRLPKNSI